MLNFGPDFFQLYKSCECKRELRAQPLHAIPPFLISNRDPLGQTFLGASMSAHDEEEPQSVLDDLGQEITGIAWPVSICMAVTVFLVRVLNPTGQSSSSTVFIASAGYDENAHVSLCVSSACDPHAIPVLSPLLQPDASGAQKLGGALLNAIIFVAAIAVITVLMVILFKYGASAVHAVPCPSI